MKGKKTRKLRLARESLRVVSNTELLRVQGGYTWTCQCQGGSNSGYAFCGQTM